MDIKANSVEKIMLSSYYLNGNMKNQPKMSIIVPNLSALSNTIFIGKKERDA